MTQENDPFAVISEALPSFSEVDAIECLREHYGLDAAVSALVSERDQNFRVRSSDGAEYVFKIANAAEPAQVTDFQVQARLCASILILEWRAAMRGADDPYLEKLQTESDRSVGFFVDCVKFRAKTHANSSTRYARQ